MPDYRRNRVPGGTNFFTVNFLERGSRLLTDNVNELRAAVAKVRNSRPFHIEGWVVLPEHMHCIWTLPEGDSEYVARWTAIKIAFSKSMPRTERRSAVRVAKGKREIWQRRYWEHSIRGDRDYAAHMEYIHFNPVKHGHVTQVQDWPYSSSHRLVSTAIYALDWADRLLGSLRAL